MKEAREIQKSGARGEETRKKLLETATRLFGSRGFDGVSTRELAAGADTTLPSIAHHFGSKEGLYYAVIADIAAKTEEMLSPVSTAAQEVLKRKDARREEVLAALENMVAQHANTVLNGPQEWTPLMVREQLNPTEAIRPVQEVWERCMIDPMTHLIARLTGTSPKGHEAKLRAVALIGRVVIFRLSRAMILKTLNWSELTPSRSHSIAEVLRSEVRAAFQIAPKPAGGFFAAE